MAMKATAPIGSGCRMKPTTVAMKTAARCHATTVTPSGTGANQMIAPTKRVIRALRCFLFMRITPFSVSVNKNEREVNKNNRKL